MKVSEIKSKLPLSEAFEIPSGTKLVIAYDINSVTRMDAIQVTNDLHKEGIAAIIVPVDGQASKEPFKMFEVQGESNAASK